MTALQEGRIDGAVLSHAHCSQLEAKGFRTLLDLTAFNMHGAPDALVVLDEFLSDSHAPKAILAGMIEAAAFAASDRYLKPAVAAVKSTLMITDDSAAEEGLRHLRQTMARNPSPALIAFTICNA